MHIRNSNRANEIDLGHLKRESSSNHNNNYNNIISKHNMNHNHASNAGHLSHLKLDTFGGGNNSSFLNEKS